MRYPRGIDFLSFFRLSLENGAYVLDDSLACADCAIRRDRIE